MIQEWSEQLRCGDALPTELMEQAFARARVNRAENAFITLTRQEAAFAATQADYLATLPGRAPLCGIPMALKDNIAVSGIPMTCASRVLSDFVPAYDASLWRNLREAGAVLIGKTNMDEFAMGARGTFSAYGAVKNPLDRSRSAGGSSSGSAAAVASGTVVYAIGTDTGGSVRVPAAYCGIVGFKPSWGRISRFGVTAFAASLDTVGILARSVADVEIVFQVIGESDQMDMTTRMTALDGAVREMETVLHQGGAANGYPNRIGILEKQPEVVSDGVWAQYTRACEMARQAGFTTVAITLPDAREAYAAYYLISAAEACSNLARFDGIRYGHSGGSRGTVDEMMEEARASFGDEVKRRILAGEAALTTTRDGETLFARAMHTRRRITAQFGAIFTECDYILTPTAPTIAPRLDDTTEEAAEASDVFTTGASLASLPAISLPAGDAKEDGAEMPVGVQLIAPVYRDETLLWAARRLEAVL